MNQLKTKQLNHTLAWSVAGLILCGGLSVMFLLLHMIYPGTIMVVLTLISFYILWKEVRKINGGK